MESPKTLFHLPFNLSSRYGIADFGLGNVFIDVEGLQSIRTLLYLSPPTSHNPHFSPRFCHLALSTFETSQAPPRTLCATLRELTQAYGLAPAVTFSDVTADADLVELLSDAYGGDIHNLDAYTGALAERVESTNGGVFGELLYAAWREQMYR